MLCTVNSQLHKIKQLSLLNSTTRFAEEDLHLNMNISFEIILLLRYVLFGTGSMTYSVLTLVLTSRDCHYTDNYFRISATVRISTWCH
jgi:hypothetical protein